MLVVSSSPNTQKCNFKKSTNKGIKNSISCLIHYKNFSLSEIPWDSTNRCESTKLLQRKGMVKPAIPGNPTARENTVYTTETDTGTGSWSGKQK